MTVSEQEFLKGAFTGDAAIVAAYLGEGGDPNARGKRGQTALMLAIWGAKNLGIVRLLAEHGADLALREESSGWRALTYAAANGLADILAYLFEIGDAVASDGSDWKALLYAAQYRNAATVGMLLAHGADADTRDEAGMTALMRAARNSDNATLTLLADAGANVDLVDAEGMTALMYTAGKANVPNVALLLERGASAAARNKAGQTALDIATAAGKSKVAAILRGHAVADAG